MDLRATIYTLLYKLLTNPWTFQQFCSLPESLQTKYHQGTKECLHTCNRTNGQWTNNRCFHFSNKNVISLKMLVLTLWLSFHFASKYGFSFIQITRFIVMLYSYVVSSPLWSLLHVSTSEFILLRYKAGTRATHAITAIFMKVSTWISSSIDVREPKISPAWTVRKLYGIKPAENEMLITYSTLISC